MTYDKELSGADLGQLLTNFLNAWALKAKASRDFWKHAPPRNFLDVNSPKFLFLGFRLRWLNTVLAVCEFISFAKSWQEKGCSSQAETWQVKNILMKDFD